MLLKPYKIIALPFAQSSLESEYEEYGTDENDAREQFQRRYPNYRIKSVEEAAL